MIPRFLRTFLIISAIIIVSTLYILYPLHTSFQRTSPSTWEGQDGGEQQRVVDADNMEDERYGYETAIPGTSSQVHGAHAHKPDLHKLETGGVIMSKLGNATAKAELGRAAWKVLHTMTLRFPESPTQDERDALKSYMHLFARLYPCGECAQEFQTLLKEYPPQTSSRKAASVWLCSVHNLVNARLGKEEFDCNALEGTYDCGCGGEEEAGASDVNETGSPTSTRS
ncbi:hypothetical protein FFLO_05769 [Filobasidium floriforme]|uniref:Sulfhydryl oxidase n=1 Tax=Filobasidium floriforme TaxID=5210 RepID=A0A8K0NMW3_9TREE|nr:hypothetical protein FFLO_05769 [Filobasidium floriforme]